MKEQRRSQIAEYLYIHRQATVKELLDKFSVSINTLRSDLDALENEGAVKKTYGGVQYVQNKHIAAITVRAIDNLEAKLAIARRAAEEVEDNDTIYIDFGTTVLNLPRFLKDRKNITIITPNLLVVNEALQYDNLTLLILPGQVNRKENAVMSENTCTDLENYTINKAFMANAGITTDGKLSVVSYVQREIKRIAMRQSKKHYLLTESNKFLYSNALHYGRLGDMDLVITDSAIGDEPRHLMETEGIRVAIVS